MHWHELGEVSAPHIILDCLSSSAKNYQSWLKFHKVVTKTILLDFFRHSVYTVYNEMHAFHYRNHLMYAWRCKLLNWVLIFHTVVWRQILGKVDNSIMLYCKFVMEAAYKRKLLKLVNVRSNYFKNATFFEPRCSVTKYQEMKNIWWYI